MLFADLYYKEALFISAAELLKFKPLPSSKDLDRQSNKSKDRQHLNKLCPSQITPLGVT